MDIRFATVEDLPALLQLEQQVFVTDLISARQMKRFISASHSLLLVAYADNQLAGYALLLFHRGTQLSRIYSIAISPNFQGRGYAKALLAKVEHEAIDRGYITIRLEVREDNLTALTLYQNLGYKPLKTLVHYYDDLASGIRMQKRLGAPEPKQLLTLPLYVQTTPFTCGAACLLMAFSYLRPAFQPNRNEEIQLWREATTIYMAAGHGGCSGRGLALAAHQRGFQVQLFSRADGIPFIDSVRAPEKKEVITLVHDNFQRQLLEANVPIEATVPSVAMLEAWLAEGACVLLLISTYRFNGNKEPHWIILSGMSELFFYFHDPEVAHADASVGSSYVPINKSAINQIMGFGKQKHVSCVVIRA
ncbi:GNAT family N-acetyltransferase/peptidase C39 family protein [Shewanella sp. NIFS-20-20]|uniref:GNAT family N-acetyltransferase/peptidase C39 family protein n=1 Tax=Shewanella sp. NIFS-20-20 TaxID=2853806 RepID=UPI001C46E8D8|nr:GNAT family N-acetyltransferase/peptidase C39 family protein [Shewanella sp. NIFS-20-20]MBV7316296.1 GNAT family N-acetyltransferase/peptidase C39 family protein [Shewanella sp. NIFS-20-20]